MGFFVYAMTCINTTKNKNDKKRNIKGVFFLNLALKSRL
jgi:hypothetical protein